MPGAKGRGSGGEVWLGVFGVGYPGGGGVSGVGDLGGLLGEGVFGVEYPGRVRGFGDLVGFLGEYIGAPVASMPWSEGRARVGLCFMMVWASEVRFVWYW